MVDPAVERITIKSARVGYTKSLMVALGAVAANDPSPIILLVPTDEDARGIAVDEVEPIFEATPALQGLIKKGRNDGRNTLTRKALVGGASIKILSARAPRKLRRHDCRVLLIDEADAMEITSEGDPIAIAEKRTLAQPGGRSLWALPRPRKASASSSGSIRSRTSECTRSPALSAAPSMKSGGKTSSARSSTTLRRRSTCAGAAAS